MLKIAVIGAGVMGANWARVLARSDYELGVVVDDDPSRAQQLATQHDVQFSGEIEAALGCDGVIIATNTEAHPALALTCIAAGRPMLVEKPLATAADEVERVVGAAAAQGVPLMCGFVERFNPAVETARQLIKDPLIHAVSLRHSPADPRAKSGVAHDLLIHDIDLVLMLAGRSPVTSVRSGQLVLPSTGQAEVADCILQLESGLLATLSASRAGQRKIRLLQLMTTTALYELDLLRADVTVYSHIGHEMQGGSYRSQTIVDIPFVRHAGEPLALELEHFVGLIRGDLDAKLERESILPPHLVADEVARS